MPQCFQLSYSDMLQDRIAKIEAHFRQFVQRHYDIDLSSLTVETPPRTEFGDLAFPFPFQLAKQLRKSPRAVAMEVASEIGSIPGVERVQAAGAGFINLFFDRAAFFHDLYAWLNGVPRPPEGSKVIVEHTNINPNKAAHIGHLRNAVLGDTFVRLLRYSGRRVEVQNYIDNTGVQVADVVVGFQHLRRMSLSDIEEIPDPFDYYCWDLYAEVSDWYLKEPSRLELRQQTLSDIEEGQNEAYSLAEHISNRIVTAHLKTMERLGVRYDVLPRESEILHLRFWDEAFELLKKTRAIYYSEEDPHRGCWVMRLPPIEGQPDEEKIIVRSNGTVTYVGKDIAYQLWKFGLLGKSFHYRSFFHYPDGHQVWVTTTEPDCQKEPNFGGGAAVYNVIDVRQSYLQRVVMEGLRSLGFRDQASRSTHFSYEMVALSPRCCRDLNIELSAEDAGRSYVEVSGRRGLGVKADDLINKLEETSLAEVNRRGSDLPEATRELIASQIAVGALRYFMLKYTRNAVIAFDFNEALSFEGETGPYLQYSVVRANNIFRKLSERDSQSQPEGWRDSADQVWKLEATNELLKENKLWSLILDLARIDEAVDQSVGSLELSGIAKHAFIVAQQFNLFYHRHHILSESDTLKKAVYLIVADASRRGLLRLLDLLGIPVPEKM